jgi:DNA-binding transcriptional LysR family regulator
MELNQLRHFLAVLRAGSINRAAAELNIRQPSLSQSIKALERSVGAELLLRTGGGVRPTRIGETFATYAQVITREADKATAEVAAMRGLGAGCISLAIHSALARYLAPTALSDFLGRSTGVRVDIAVFSFSAPEVVQRLRRAEWDIVVTLVGDPADYPADIVKEALRPIESRVYCGADHPLAGKEAVSVADLARYEWIVTNISLTERLLAKAFEQVGCAPLIRIRTDSMELIPEFAAVYPFLCILPIETAAHDVAEGRLVEVRQNSIRSASDIAILSSALVARTAATRTLIGAVAARTALTPLRGVARSQGSR